VKKMPLQCGRMVMLATEYCALIDTFERAEHNGRWRATLGKLFPRLHVAVIALREPLDNVHYQVLYDDDQRCELFLQLSNMLQTDELLWAAYDRQALTQNPSQTRRLLCERMADNLTDMYFDLKQGLAQVENDPLQATSDWQCSFYAHWGKHLLDAECWLHAVAVGDEPVELPEWRWPNPANVPLSLVGQ
jgi:Domain of unknown function (DUF5063)